MFKDKNISKGIQEMHILQKDESLKNNSLKEDKHFPSGYNSPPKDKLLLKEKNSNEILFFSRGRNKKKKPINPTVIFGFHL